MGSAAMPAAGAGAGATAVPAGQTGATPAAAPVAALVPVRGAVTAFWAGGLQDRLGGQCQPQCLPLLFPPFPFKALNQVEQGSVGVGQTPARCGDLCLSGVPRMAAHFFQIFY